MKFTGHERDLGSTTSAADDLDYMHARHFGPLVGRFLSVDPIGGNPRAPLSWNRYSYVVGNPMTLTDPTGLQAWGAFAAASFFGGIFGMCETITVTGQLPSADPAVAMQGLADLENGAALHYGGNTSSGERSFLGRLLDRMYEGNERARQLGLFNGTYTQCVDSGECKIGMMPLLPGGVFGRIDPNKLHHPFGRSYHNLEPIVTAAGGRVGAYRAIESATQQAVNTSRTTGLFKISVKVFGYNVTVEGAVINGMARISTAYR